MKEIAIQNKKNSLIEQLECLLDSDLHIVSYYKDSLFRGEALIYERIALHLEALGYSIEFARAHIAFSMWYYATLVNYDLYANAGIGNEYYLRVLDIIKSECTSMGVDCDIHVIKELASILHWKRMLTLAERNPGFIAKIENEIFNLWNLICPSRWEFYNIRKYMAGKTESNSPILNKTLLDAIVNEKLQLDKGEQLRNSLLRNFVKLFCFRFLVQENILADLIFESLEHFIPFKFNYRIESIAAPLIFIINRIKNGKKNAIELYTHVKEEETIALFISDIESPHPSLFVECKTLIEFAKQWEEWKNLQNPKQEEFQYLIYATIFKLKNNEEYYTYCYNQLYKDEECLKFLNDLCLLKELSSRCPQKDMKIYLETRGRGEHAEFFEDEKRTFYDADPPRDIKTMLINLDLPGLTPIQMDCPESLCDKLEEINFAIKRYCKLGQNFEYFFGNGEWDKDKGSYLEWSTDWNVLSYFLRVLYKGYLTKNGTIDVSSQMPKGIWKNATKIFKDKNGKSPSEDTLKKMTVKEHLKRRYAERINEIMKPILKGTREKGEQ